MALLKQYKSDFGTIRITRSKRDGSMAYWQNGCYHSQADKQGISICIYVHVIQEIIRQSRARNVLIIGCAGGTLATMLRRLNCRVTVVDINAVSFTLARRYFNLPDDVGCVRRDGIAYLRNTRKEYDAVVIDVFGSNNNVPQPFTTPAFFQTVRDACTPSAVMVMNVITAHDGDLRADRIARNAEKAGMDITMFDWPRQMHRNTLVVSGIKDYTRIPSGKEPEWIKGDLVGIIRRKPRKTTLAVA